MNKKLPSEALAAELEALRNLESLICSAAPLAWVASGDMDGAGEWERRAEAALAELRKVREDG